MPRGIPARRYETDTPRSTRKPGGGGGAGGREAPEGRGSGGLIAGVFAPQSVCGGGGGRRFLESNYGIRRAAAILREGRGQLSPININSGAHRRLTSYCPPVAIAIRRTGTRDTSIGARNSILISVATHR